jgi:DNA helicase INO80
MDRAHRVGQTRQVTVYRLICKGTVEERMLHLARNKKDVQDIVVGNKSVAEVNSGKEIVSMLLDDEDVSGAASRATSMVETGILTSTVTTLQDSGALAGGFSRAHGMVTDVGNPLMGGGDGDDDNFFGNAIKKPAATAVAAGGDADGAKPVKKRRKTAAAVVAEDGEGEGSGTAAGVEVKPKRVRKKKAEGEDGEGGGEYHLCRLAGENKRTDHAFDAIRQKTETSPKSKGGERRKLLPMLSRPERPPVQGQEPLPKLLKRMWWKMRQKQMP